MIANFGTNINRENEYISQNFSKSNFFANKTQKKQQIVIDLLRDTG